MKHKNKKKILIYENNPFHHELIRHKLEQGYLLISLSTLDDFYKQVKQGQADLLLVDIQGIDASETIAQIRKLDDQIPLVIMSHKKDETLMIQLIKNGADEFILKKKENHDKLIEIIKKTIRKPHKQEKQTDGSLQKMIKNMKTLTEFISQPSKHPFLKGKQIKYLENEIDNLKQMMRNFLPK